MRAHVCACACGGCEYHIIDMHGDLVRVRARVRVRVRVRVRAARACACSCVWGLSQIIDMHGVNAEVMADEDGNKYNTRCACACARMCACECVCLRARQLRRSFNRGPACVRRPPHGLARLLHGLPGHRVVWSGRRIVWS